MGTSRRARSLLAGLAAGTVGLAGLAVVAGPPALANAGGTGLVISEAYGGGGNGGGAFKNDFVEIYNPTSAPITMTNWSIQYRAIGNNAVATNITTLNGTVGSHGYFLVQEAVGGDTTQPALPTPDATGTIAMAGTGFQVWLANTTTGQDPADGNILAGTPNAAIIDLVGVGTTAVSYEGATRAPVIANGTSAQRTPLPGTDSDVNGTDFVAGAPTPMNAGAVATPLAATDPADVTAFVNSPIANINLAATGGTAPYTWDISGLPAGLSETSEGVIGGTPTAVGTSTVSATVTDSASPTHATSTVEFTVTVEAAPSEYTIAELQGTGNASPHVNETVITKGVVTAVYPNGTNDFAGFYLQTGGGDGADNGTPGASDAIFVFMGAKTSPAIGTSVQVQGKVTEFFGTTEISPSFAANVTTLGSPLPAVVPGDVVPGTDCALPGDACLTGAALDAAREAHEGELFQPTGDYTVTDSYDGSPFTQSGSAGFAMQGEIGLAAESTSPLMVPTEVVDQSDAAGLEAVNKYNDAHKLILDDGSDTDYTTNANEDTPYPWLTLTHPVRVGAPVTFPKPVVLRYDFGFWRIQPQTKVAGGEDGQDRVAIQNTRTNAPEDVLGSTGDLKIATFNMLNYFNTYGEDWAASDGIPTGSPNPDVYTPDTNPRRCSYFTDRGTPGGGGPPAARITNDECTQDAVDPLTQLNVKLPGPRGAANEANFLRQEAKELEAINSIDADVMSLEEVENSIKLYDPDLLLDGPNGVDKDRDDALKHLVLKLNEHWAAAHPSYVGDRWAYAPSPRPEALPTVTEQDAIRSAFIYNPSKVEPVGPSEVLVNSAPFRNAREPLAQAFKPLGGGRADAFIVIVNHLKSKGGPTAPATVNGDNVDAGDGAGFYNGDRKRQAAALVAFAQQISSDKNIDPVFFTGDFNSYAKEDPIQVIEAAGYTTIEPANGETTYSFGGLAGSLDHVFANPAALSMVTGEDVWSINANESVYYEYSRFNANAANLYDGTAFRSSDHNPEIIGIDVGDLTADPDADTVQILATNDFHGRILDDPGSAAAGAASMAGAVKQLRGENENTIFAAAGDLVGASTFESFIQNDEPTIDALNEAGLEVSSVGNHEFDKGYQDIVDRLIPHADWKYLGANVKFNGANGHTAGDPALPETWCRTLPNGKVVGFVGAVTEDLPALVAGAGIADIEVTDIVDAVNENADELKGPDGCATGVSADLVIELVHEGAATTAYSSVTDSSTFAQIVAGTDENVDAIVSGHTHLAYNHKVPVQQWIDESRAVTKRPVVSAGQYGSYLNRLQFEFAPGTDDLVDIRQTVLALKDYDADPATQGIVDGAVSFAETEGNVPLGDIEGPFKRARRIGDDGQISENRGGESTLGNQIAEIQRWKTDAEIGFMNPGGLRADLLGSDADPRVVNYRQAANTQPFANTLETMDLTGAQIKKVLEQQWQRDADGNIPSRPFLRLGTSEGFTATYDPTAAEGSHVTGMWLDGTPIDPGTTYKVSVTSFLAGAGDNFWELGNGANAQDTGLTDLQAVVDYLSTVAHHDSGDVLPVAYAQHQVGVKVSSPATAPYVAGNSVTLNVSSLAMTGVDDVQDTQVELFDGATSLGTGAVTNTLTASPDDSMGTATVTFTVPAGVGDGTTLFRLVGNNTGTEINVPVETSDGLVDSTVSGGDQNALYGDSVSIPVLVTPNDATGTVTLKEGGNTLGQATLDSDAMGTITLSGGALSVGVHHLTLVYSGDGTYGGVTGTVTVTVLKRTTSIQAATPDPSSVEVETGTSDIDVTVSADFATPTGGVTASVGGSVVDTQALDGDGKATLTVGPFSTVGNQDVTIDYVGDANTTAVSTTATVAVTRHATTVSATCPAVTYGTGWNASVGVSPNSATGQVTVSEGGTTLGSATLSTGTASVAIGGTALQPGAHTLTVSYAGDATHAASTSTCSVTVQAPPNDGTTTTITPPAGTLHYGTPSTFTVSVVSAGPVTGTVELRDGSTLLGSAALTGGAGAKHAAAATGTATITVPATALSVGSHTLTAKYLGDHTNDPSEATVHVEVAKAVSTTALTVDPGHAVVGQDEITLTAEVSATGVEPTGQVVFAANGVEVGTATMSGGSATLTIGPGHRVTTYDITAVYQGDANVATSTDSAALKVVKAHVSIRAKVTPKRVVVDRTSPRLVVTVRAAGQSVTGRVRVRWQGTMRILRLEHGKATLSLGTWASIGDKKVGVHYLGSARAGSAATSVTVRVRPRHRR